MKMKNILFLAITVTLVTLGISAAQNADEKTVTEPQPKQQADAQVKPSGDDPAIERTRRQVKMLDDIYKGGIVLITKNYVNGDEDLPAGTAFKKLFEAAKEKAGTRYVWSMPPETHTTTKMSQISDFEKRAVEQLKAGKPFVDETVTQDDGRYFLAATPIPVVMEKCTMCHSNYEMNGDGTVIGALTYRVPIDE